ncbi:hypothetical protein ACG74X_19875 [Marivita sp. S0852]|uniref:hypothetical protein n=1 Tax=Marivita sp. S0852 TaxID=3373893 RepID=UPI003981FDF0
MTLRFDTAFFERHAAHEADMAGKSLKAALARRHAASGAPADHLDATDRIVDASFEDAAELGVTDPVTLQKYALTILTQSRWRSTPTHFAYIRRMIGTPGQPWSPDAGIRAAYDNVVAPYHLDATLADHIARIEGTRGDAP